MSKVSIGPFADGDEYTHYLYFFANPRSGDQAAKRYLKAKQERTFNLKFDDYSVNLFGHIFNVTQEREKQYCYRLIQKTYKQHKNNKDVKMMVVLMGGDGGLMRAMTDLRPIVDLRKITFIALPFGSGNDLA